MQTNTQQLIVYQPPTEVAPPPFAKNIIQITQADYIALKWKGNYWEAQHAQASKKLAEKQKELDLAKATIRDLNQRLYGKKSEKKGSKKDSASNANGLASSRPRGQQKGSTGHGRTQRPDLPVVEEISDILPQDRQCQQCGKGYRPLGKTEDSKIIEVRVKAHVRLVKRNMYAQSCQCSGVPGLITAPPAPRLIPKSIVGISVWTEVLINKFLFARATYNLCKEYEYRGLPIAPGTITGGLQKMAPLFEPLMERWKQKQLTETLFHNDETGWKVFEAVEGKVGYRWYLWVTRSPSVVYYTMAPSRSGDIPIDYFSGLDKSLDQVIVVCDRYSAYKRLARENTLILLAFCWAHVRRDFLDAARSWPDLQTWMHDWVDKIGTLYHLNAQRLLWWDEDKGFKDQTDDFVERHQTLAIAVDRMSEQCGTELDKDDLHKVQRSVLNSLKNHWPGLTVFVKQPHVPMDNNPAERCMRPPVTGRKNYYGSGRQWSAELASTGYSLLQTVILWQLNPHHWLHSYLTACADNGGNVPADLSAFIPWEMTQARKDVLKKPLPQSTATNEPSSATPPHRSQSP